MASKSKESGGNNCPGSENKHGASIATGERRQAVAELEATNGQPFMPTEKDRERMTADHEIFDDRFDEMVKKQDDEDDVAEAKPLDESNGPTAAELEEIEGD